MKSKFTKFQGNNDCPKCHGVGSYKYDDMHGKICEECCTHPEGFHDLYAIDPEGWSSMKGKEVCKFGCGFERIKSV